MASDVCHLGNRSSISPPLGSISVVDSAAFGISPYAISINKMDVPIDGGLPKSPRSPKFKAAPQRPGPNGSRVVRRRPSIPRLGAGLGQLVVQINNSLVDVTDPPVANHNPIADVAKCSSDRMLSAGRTSDPEILSAPKNSRRVESRPSSVDTKVTLKPIIPQEIPTITRPFTDKEVEGSSILYGSPISSTEEGTSFASSTSFDGIHLSSPDSTPPPSNERVHGKPDSSPTTVTTDYTFQSTCNYLPTHQSILYLADKLRTAAPVHLMNVGDNGCSRTGYAALAAPPPDELRATAPVEPRPFLGPTNSQVKQFYAIIDSGSNSDYMNQFENRNGAWPAVTSQFSPVKQPNQDYTAVPFTPYSPNISSSTRSTEDRRISFVSRSSFSKFSPQVAATQPDIQQSTHLFEFGSKKEKLLSLECKLTRHVHEDAKWPDNSSTGVHVFVDMSNIGIGFLNSAKAAMGKSANYYLKAPFSFENLARILERGRNIQKRVLAGSLAFPASRRENWPLHLREADILNYEMNIFDRVQVEKRAYKPKRKNRTPPQRSVLYSPSDITSADESTEDGATAKIIRKNGEQGVDENLHLNMMHSILDNTEPGTMVLATGDAAQAQFSDGFKNHATRALKAGWKVEVVSWSRTMSSAWYDPEFVAEYGDQVRIIELDEFIDELHADPT